VAVTLRYVGLVSCHSGPSARRRSPVQALIDVVADRTSIDTVTPPPPQPASDDVFLVGGDHTPRAA